MTRPRCSLGPTQRQIQLALRHMAPAGHPLRDVVIKEPTKRAKRNNQPEQILQISICKLLSQLPATLYFSIPNHLYLGGKMTGAKAGYIARQKMAGMLPGCADLSVVFRNCHGATVIVFLELKSQTGSLSDAQKAFLDTTNSLGCYTGIVRSLDDLTSLLKLAGHISFQS